MEIFQKLVCDKTCLDKVSSGVREHVAPKGTSLGRLGRLNPILILDVHSCHHCQGRS